MILQNKWVLVTGASRGIGRATALAFAEKGANVIVHYHQKKQEAEAVVAEIKSKGVKAFAIQGDVAKHSDVVKMHEIIQKEIGGAVDVLVNNAGAHIRTGDWKTMPPSDVERVIAINLTSILFMTQVFAPSMIARKSGSIVNVASTYGITGAAPVIAYTSAKAGAISATYAMARELGPHGVTVNAIAPGNIDTEMTRAAGQGVIDWAISTTPAGRLGQADEIAEAILFLVQSPFTNGHVMVVDGGQLLNM